MQSHTLWVNTSMSNTYPIFADMVTEGLLPLSDDIAQRISMSIKQEKKSPNAVETHYGWCTDEFKPLGGDLRKLQSLLVQTFFAEFKKQHKILPKMKIELVRPWLTAINPGHTVDRDNTTRRWYTGVVWLQTTDKGSALKLHAPQLKTHTTPHGVMPFSKTIFPEQFKYVFWPAHIEHSFAVNSSFAESVLLQFTVHGGVPGIPGPGNPGK